MRLFDCFISQMLGTGNDHQIAELAGIEMEVGFGAAHPPTSDDLTIEKPIKTASRPLAPTALKNSFLVEGFALEFVVVTGKRIEHGTQIP